MRPRITKADLREMIAAVEKRQREMQTQMAVLEGRLDRMKEYAKLKREGPSVTRWYSSDLTHELSVSYVPGDEAAVLSAIRQELREENQ